MTDIRLKTDDCHFGDRLHKFRVRASKEFSFSMEVTAHDVGEAKIVAENFCEAMGSGRWTDLAENAHMTFEGESLCENRPSRRRR